MFLIVLFNFLPTGALLCIMYEVNLVLMQFIFCVFPSNKQDKKFKITKSAHYGV